jgi:hypothetical protein
MRRLNRSIDLRIRLGNNGREMKYLPIAYHAHIVYLACHWDVLVLLSRYEVRRGYGVVKGRDRAG